MTNEGARERRNLSELLVGPESGSRSARLPSHAASRRPRPTKRPRMSELDRFLLRWIGEQHTARLDVIAQLLGRDEAVTQRRARAITQRWKAMGLARSAEMIARVPSFVWLTGHGMTAAGLTYPVHRPHFSTLAHHHTVALTRLAIERTALGHHWMSERAIALAASRYQHIPDGVYLDQQERDVAVEVELTRKSAARLRGIIGELAGDYSRIVYVTDSRAIATAVTDAAGSIGVTDRLTITSLSELSPPR